MVKKFFDINNFEKLIAISAILFLFNLIFPFHKTAVLYIINELLVFGTLVILYENLSNQLISKSNTPLTLIINSGIISSVIFFILSITNSLYTTGENGAINISFFNTLISTIVIFIFIASLVYILSSFKVLFYLRQKKDPTTYFNTMLIFIAFSFLSNLLLAFDSTIDYPRDTFFIVSILLITINSVRVAWIAFLTKKQKKYLLLISIVLAIINGMAFSLVMESNVVKKILYLFSPGIHTILALIMIYGCIYYVVIFFTTLFHLPTAEAFDRKALQVTTLMDITKLMTQVFDFKELANSITTLTTEICNSDSAWLITFSKNKIKIDSVYKIELTQAEKISNNILQQFENIKEVLVLNNDKIRNNSEAKYKSYAIAPLKIFGKINGYLFTAREKENYFDEEEKKSVETFANYAAVALENAMLIKESIEKERLEKELDVAREIQKKLLPIKTPQNENLEISALFVPAFEVGGDYYDFFNIDENKMAFVIADVSGKGISAAFIMSEVKGIFKSISKIINTPKELLIKANEILKESLDKKNFVTVIYGIFDYENKKVVISRAGHTPLIHYSKGKANKIQPSGIGLGIDYSNNFLKSLEEVEINLNNNDILVCYSDGITEAKNSLNEDFGYKRLENVIELNHDRTTDEISNEIMKEVSLFTKDNSQHDDITLVIFKWKK